MTRHASKKKHAHKQSDPATTSGGVKRKTNDSPSQSCDKRTKTNDKLPTELSTRNQTTEESDLFDDHSMSEGVISDNEVICETPATQLIVATKPNQATNYTPLPASTTINQETEARSRTITPSPKAQVNLYDDDFLARLPDNLKTLHMISQSHNLSRINPMKLYTCLNNLCGEIENLTHLRNGGLLLECKSSNQAKTLLKTKILSFSNPELQVNIQTTISLSKETCAGKIYAPELQDMTLNEILDLLKPSGAIEIQKLLTGTSKAHVPLYIIKFLGTTCPEQIKIGYSRYNVDKYIPNPLCCSKCWRWGHGSKFCRNRKICRNCGRENHLHENCTLQPHCINCRGGHSATSPLCPVLQREKNICKIHVEKQITLKEARQQVINSKNRQNMSPHTYLTRTPPSPAPPNPPLSGNIESSMRIDESSITLPSLSQTTTYQQSGSNSIYENYTSQDYPPLPSLGNLQDTNKEQDSQDDEITPAQKMSRRQPDKNYSSTLKTNPNRNSQKTSAHPQPSSQKDNTLPWLQNLIKTILPIVIRMIFATTSTARLECLHEIGTILSMETTITEIISNLGYTSLINL